MFRMHILKLLVVDVIGVVRRDMSNPGKKHWEVVQHILRYLKGTLDAQLTFGLITSTEVEGYRLRLCRKQKQSEINIRLHLHLRGWCDITKVEISRVHGSVDHKGRVHSNIGGSKGSDLAAPTICRLLSYK